MEGEFNRDEWKSISTRVPCAYHREHPGEPSADCGCRISYAMVPNRKVVAEITCADAP